MCAYMWGVDVCVRTRVKPKLHLPLGGRAPRHTVTIHTNIFVGVGVQKAVCRRGGRFPPDRCSIEQTLCSAPACLLACLRLFFFLISSSFSFFKLRHCRNTGCKAEGVSESIEQRE